MRQLMMGAMALSLLISPAVSAQPDHGPERGEEHGRGPEQGRGEERGHDQGQRWRNDHGPQRGWAQDRGQDYRWRRGQRMGYNDWNNAERVDYRRYRLRQPPRGYEWRRQNDQFVLGAIATGVITSIILNAGR